MLLTHLIRGTLDFTLDLEALPSYLQVYGKNFRLSRGNLTNSGNSMEIYRGPVFLAFKSLVTEIYAAIIKVGSFQMSHP